MTGKAGETKRDQQTLFGRSLTVFMERQIHVGRQITMKKLASAVVDWRVREVPNTIRVHAAAARAVRGL